MRKELMATRTMGAVSAKFLGTLQKRGKTIFSLAEAKEIYGKNRYATGDFLSDLVKRGLLARIKAGSFLILQAGHENTQLKNWPIIARELAGKDPYFISHYSAMRLHGMTTHPVLTVFLTVSKRKPEKVLSGIAYHFIYSKKKHFWGGTTHWATKQDQVEVSDLERTVLDGLDRPDLCGGIIEIARGIWEAQRKVDFKKLSRHAKKFRTQAAVKRLGFLLETLNIASNAIPSLLKCIASAHDYVLLDPQGRKKGKYLRRWRLQLNLNLEEIKESVWG